MDKYIDVVYYLDHFSLNKESLKVYEILLKKFELKRVIYTGYKNDFEVNYSFKELSSTYYQKMVMCFMFIFILKKDVRFYNTALKISDKINIQIPSVNILELYEGN